MIAPADPRPVDVLDRLVEYRTDPDAQPGNVVPALAALLIDLAQRRNDQQQGGTSDE